MKLPSSVPESKSMEHLVVPVDPADGTAKVGSLMFFLRGTVILIWRLINKIKVFAKNRTENWKTNTSQLHNVCL